MTRLYLFVPMALLLSATMGCSERAAQDQRIGAVEEAQLAVQAQAGDAEAARQLERLQKARDAVPDNEPVYTPDIHDGWQWSVAEIAALKKRALSGDMEAADRLHQYYSVHEDEANIAFWEDWLFKHGDKGAIAKRAHKLYSASQERPVGDPRKLTELKEAERLWLTAYSESDDIPFLDTLRSAIASLEASK